MTSSPSLLVGGCSGSLVVVQAVLVAGAKIGKAADFSAA
jgi:hypothetical protein